MIEGRFPDVHGIHLGVGGQVRRHLGSRDAEEEADVVPIGLRLGAETGRRGLQHLAEVVRGEDEDPALGIGQGEGLSQLVRDQGGHVLAARSGLEDEVAGLEIGADIGERAAQPACRSAMGTLSRPPTLTPRSNTTWRTAVTTSGTSPR